MELKHYLEILSRRWWIVAGSALLALVSAGYLTAQQPWIYEADATFVVRPRLVDAEDAVKAIDTLIRGGEINETMAKIATSDAIVDRAKATLGRDIVSGSATSVTANVVAGTNILRLTVSGHDPLVVKEYTDEIAGELVTYIDGLEDVFTLAPLDGANLPNNPAGPKKLLTVVLAGILGTTAGILIAATVEYLSEPAPKDLEFNIVDPQTHALNEGYFRKRFDQELSRARNTGQPFVLAAIQLAPQNSIAKLETGDPRELADALSIVVRPEDVLAYIGNLMFMLLIPATTESEAEVRIAEWRDEYSRSSTAMSGAGESLDLSIGICEYGGGEHEPALIGIGSG
jgi:GGDEF domain-containing protein/capsular polysaccharide biosynthesis protein